MSGKKRLRELAFKRYSHSKHVAFSGMFCLSEEAGGGFMMIKVRFGERNWLKTPQPNLPLWHFRDLKICGKSCQRSRF